MGRHQIIGALAAAAALCAGAAQADDAEQSLTYTEGVFCEISAGSSAVAVNPVNETTFTVDIDCNDQFDLTFTSDAVVANDNPNIQFDSNDFFNAFTVNASVAPGELTPATNSAGAYVATIADEVVVDVTPEAPAGEPVAGSYSGTMTVTISVNSPTATN
ncbi:MAG: hypothetical protein AAFR16_03580 [Pseudomonadota bacterium]